MGGRGDSSRTAKSSAPQSVKPAAAGSLRDVLATDGQKNEFATSLRDDIYNFILTGDKLDVTDVMSNATTKRKKYQSVDIYYKDLTRTQRHVLADFLRGSRRYYAEDAGGFGIRVFARAEWNEGLETSSFSILA